MQTLEPSIATAPPEVINVRWATNYNNKLGCPAMLHLDMAPATMPTCRDMERKVVLISTDDGSHPPVQYRLLDIHPLEPRQVQEHLTLVSHGMTPLEFTAFIFSTHPGDQLSKQGFALYVYVLHPGTAHTYA